MFALAFTNFDNFENFNNLYNHPIGDAIERLALQPDAGTAISPHCHP
jgi:hypothetical protein